MEPSENLVRVTIFGQQYTVKGRAHSNYITDVAAYVDGKMREISSNLRHPQSDLRIAILAAMNITDELFSLRKEHEQYHEDIDEKTNALINIIDENL